MREGPHILVERMIARARAHPDKVALYFKDSAVTYGELERRVARAAAFLSGLGLKQGDRVALMLRNRLEYCDLSYAIWWIGAVLVPINVTFSEDEVRQTLRDSGASCCIANGEFFESVSKAAAAVASIQLVDADTTLQEMMERDFTDVPLAPPRADRLAIIAYTSGTTGTPKGAMLDDQHLADGMDHMAKNFDFGPYDNIMQPFPVHSVNPCRVGMWLAINLGSTGILLERFNAEVAADMISRHKVSFFATVPTMLYDIMKLENSERFDFSSLRFVLYGGAPTPPALKAAIEERFNIQMMQSYGSTEAARLAIDSPVVPSPPGSAGQVIECAKVSVRDTDGNALPAGEIGEFWVRGADKPDRWGFTFRPILGYWNDPAKTAEAMPDGWYRTGDLGYVDEAGWLYVVDRVKDMLIRGGNNIYPAELERALLDDPQVEAAYVIGLADERLGQVPMAYIVPTPGSESADIDEIVRTANAKLAKIKRIERAEWIAASDLPKNAMNKVLKRELTRMAHEIHEKVAAV